MVIYVFLRILKIFIMYSKKAISVLLLFFLIGSSTNSFAQADRDTAVVSNKIVFLIITNSGGEFVGYIITQDEKEVLIDTKDRGRISIPKYEIREMREVKGMEMNAKGEFVADDFFATRYFLTTNAMPIEQGESYILWNIYGPEAHFGVAKNLTMGVMSTWIGIPIIGSIKYTIPLGENAAIGVGSLVGTGSWAVPNFFVGLPYTSLTIGNRRANINIMGGFGVLGYEESARGGMKTEGTFLYSIGGLAKLGKKASFVFDSFFVYDQSNGMNGLIIPGIRIQTKRDAAFQFGFAAILTNNEGLIPAPIPMLGWFKKI